MSVQKFRTNQPGAIAFGSLNISDVRKQRTKGEWLDSRAGKKESGGDLLSHAMTHAVPSALRSLTAVFGMGTGVSSSQLPPPQIEKGFTSE